jgi:hypothetical protein
MADIRKVISPLSSPSLVHSSITVPPFTVNYTKSPEGDRPVFLNRIGHLELDSPPLMSSVKINHLVQSAADSRAYSEYHILSSADGGYFGANGTLTASDLDICRYIIVLNPGVGTAPTFTLPPPGGAGGIITYLKNKYGAENIVCGLSWKIIFINDGTQASEDVYIHILTPPAAGTGTNQCFGFDKAGLATYAQVYLPGQTGGAVPPTSGTIHFVLTNVTPGSEQITYYLTN